MNQFVNSKKEADKSCQICWLFQGNELLYFTTRVESGVNISIMEG